MAHPFCRADLRLWVYIAMSVWAIHCREPSPPAPEIDLDRFDRESAQSSPSGSTLQDRLAHLQLVERTGQVYSLLCYYTFWDTLENAALDRYFREKFTDTWSGTSALLKPDLRANPQYAENLLGAFRPQQLSPALLRDAQGHEWAMAVVVSVAQKLVQIRLLHVETLRLTPLISHNFRYPIEVSDEVSRSVFDIGPLEANIVEVDGKKVKAALRVPAGMDAAEFGVRQYFWVFQGNSRVLDSLVCLDTIGKVEDYWIGEGTYLGIGDPRVKFKLIRAFLPGGIQTFRLVNPWGQPQSGLTVSYSYSSFNKEHLQFLKTTDPSGEFSLEDTGKKPLYLVVTKNLEGVDHPFVRKLIIVEPEQGTTDIPVGTLDSLPMETVDAEEIKKLVRNFLIRAQEHIQKQELEAAVELINTARQQIQKIEHLPDQEQLREKLDNLDKNYQQLWEQKQAREKYDSVLKFLEEMDEAVKQMNYERARKMLDKVHQLWPEKQYTQVYDEVKKREQRLDALVREMGTPLGGARIFLAKELPLVKADQLSSARLDQIEGHLKILFTEGEGKEDRIYHDLNLRVDARTALDKLAGAIYREIERYRQQYDIEVSGDKRREIAKIQENYTRYRRRIDEWLATYR